MFQPCQAVKKKHLFGSVVGTWFGVKCRSWKSPFENTSLQAPIPTWKPTVWFLGSEWGPHLELKSSKMEAWNAHVNLWDPKVVPRWPQAPKLTQNGSQTHSTYVPKSMLLDTRAEWRSSKLPWKKNDGILKYHQEISNDSTKGSAAWGVSQENFNMFCILWPMEK